METYRKNYNVTTEAQAIGLLTAQDDAINTPVIGQATPKLDSYLLKIWNGGEHLTWQWDEETQAEYDARITQETAEADELALLESNNDHFKDVKLRRWRNNKLIEWIDETFIKPLKYPLTATQETERVDLRQELLDWPALGDFDSYKTDEEIGALKPSAPTWIT